MAKDTAALRKAVGQYLATNSTGLIKAVKQYYGQIGKEEYESLQSGSIDYYSDQQLAERFNPKVLGALGIDPKAYYAYRDGKYYDYQGRYYDYDKNQYYYEKGYEKK